MYDKGNPDQTTLFGIAYKDSERGNYHQDHEQLYGYWSKVLAENRSEDLLVEQSKLILNPKDLALNQTVLASIYFSKQEYSEAYRILKKINESSLDDKFLEEYYFKLGYLSLVNYRFDESLEYLEKSLNHNAKNYKEESRYYRGMSNYFLGNFEETVKDFESLRNVQDYQPYLPYYLTQIYFTQGKYEKVIEYGKQHVQFETTENIFEIEKLIGQSYFKLQDYRNALIHFNIYEKNVKKLNKEEFYQIAYTFYQLGEYKSAIPMFLEINQSDKELGQIVNYYLADCYLKTNDRQSALTAFKNVKNNNADQGLQSIAKLNYAKLAYELGNDRLSIKTLANYKEGEENYQEAQDLLGEILIRSSDFQTAMLTIEQLPSKSEKILKAYQILAFNSAISSQADNHDIKAITFFNIAKETPGDHSIKVESIFWLAYIYDKQGKTKRSQEYLQTLFAQPGISTETVYFNAKYLSAYQYYRSSKLSSALIDFQEADLAYNKNIHSSDQHIDILTRIGDLLYLNKQFQTAKKYYQQANHTDNEKVDYVLFQLGNIEAALGNKYESILAMEELIKSRPLSNYVIDAHYYNAENYLSLNMPIPALEEYKKIISKDNVENKYYVSALLKSALITYNNGDLKSALEYYRRVFNSNATGIEKKEALNALEEIYVDDLNDPQSFFDFAQEEVGLKIDDFVKDSLSFNVANSKFKTLNFRDAVIGFDKYLDSYPEGYYMSEALYLRAESYSQLREYSEALISYKLSLQSEKSRYYPDALKKACLISFNHENDFTTAGELAMKALQLNLTDSERKDYFEIAVVSLYNTQKFENLLSVSDNLIAMGNLEDFELAKVYFYKAKALSALNKIDPAIMAYNKVVQHSKNNQAAEASYELAKIFYNLGSLEKAENQALETTKRAANYPSWVAKSLILLSKIYLKQGDSFNAIAAVDAVLENYTSDENIIEEAKNQKVEIQKYQNVNSRIKNSTEEGTIELDTTKKN